MLRSDFSDDDDTAGVHAEHHNALARQAGPAFDDLISAGYFTGYPVAPGAAFPLSVLSGNGTPERRFCPFTLLTPMHTSEAYDDNNKPLFYDRDVYPVALYPDVTSISVNQKGFYYVYMFVTFEVSAATVGDVVAVELGQALQQRVLTATDIVNGTVNIEYSSALLVTRPVGVAYLTIYGSERCAVTYAEWWIRGVLQAGPPAPDSVQTTRPLTPQPTAENQNYAMTVNGRTVSWGLQDLHPDVAHVQFRLMTLAAPPQSYLSVAQAVELDTSSYTGQSFEVTLTTPGWYYLLADATNATGEHFTMINYGVVRVV